MRGAAELPDFMEYVALDEGRERDEYGDLLDEKEQSLVDSYDKATCCNVKENFYVNKLKEALGRHKQHLYDHTSANKEYFAERCKNNR